MKVYRSEATTKLIAILDLIFDDQYASVRNIRDRLLKLNPGDPISQNAVDKIFGNWADYNADPGNPRHVISFICAFLKTEMFRD